MSSSLPMIIAATATGSIALLFSSLFSFRRAVPVPDREYMDPLPARLRLVWPVVLFFAHYLGRFLSVEYVERTRTQLVRSGLYFIMTPDQFFALKLTSALLA